MHLTSSTAQLVKLDHLFCIGCSFCRTLFKFFREQTRYNNLAGTRNVIAPRLHIMSAQEVELTTIAALQRFISKHFLLLYFFYFFGKQLLLFGKEKIIEFLLARQHISTRKRQILLSPDFNIVNQSSAAKSYSNKYYHAVHDTNLRHKGLRVSNLDIVNTEPFIL